MYQGIDCYVRTIYDLLGVDLYSVVLRDKEILGVVKSNIKYVFKFNEER